MATSSAWVALGPGATLVGIAMVIAWVFLRDEAISGVGLLLGLGIVLIIGGIVGGVTVYRKTR